MHTSDDATEQARLRHVRPPGWRNPAPAPVYDLIAIGGGTAGLVCAMGAAGLGARVALVERHLLGGDCLNTGCVPSKALITSARAVGALHRAASLGVVVPPYQVDGAAVMRRVRTRRADIAEHDAADRLARAGVDVFLGQARFADATSLVVDGHRLRFNRAVIATGARPVVPSIPGLDTVRCLTSETVFEMPDLPRRLAVLGAGPVGCELAQAFARLGTAVTLIDRAARVLPRDDADASAVVHRRLAAEGVSISMGTEVVRATAVDGESRLQLGAGASSITVIGADAVLVAVGRAAAVADLALDAAGVQTTAHGVMVDDYLRTTNPRVYAVGDACGSHQFTHAADAMARLVLQNALFFGRRRVSRLVMPWVTYTSPEVAHVGVSHAEAAGSDGRISTITVPLSAVDRAIVDDETDGFVRVHHERGRLRGCTVVAPHAGEMIGEAAYAITHGGTLGQFSATVHPYPTASEAFRKAGDAYRREALSDGVRRWLGRYFAWTR